MHHTLAKNIILFLICSLLSWILNSALQAQTNMISTQKNTTSLQDSSSHTTTLSAFKLDFITVEHDNYGLLYKVLHEGEIQDSSELTFEYKVFYPDTIEQINTPKKITVPPAVLSMQKPQYQHNDTLLFYIILTIVILFTFIKHNYPKYIKELYRSFNNINISRQFFEDQRYSTSFASLLIYIGSMLTFSITCYILLRYFGYLSTYPDHLAILLCFGIIGGFLLLKYVVLRTIAFVLPLKLTLNWYIFSAAVHNCVLSFALLPLMMIVGFAETTYANTAIALFVILLIFVFAYRLYVGTVIGKEFLLFHKFHFFIYLCVLEIAPLIIMIKVVQKIVI